MAERIPVFFEISSNMGAYTGVDPAADSVTFAGLTMNGEIAMDGTGGGSPNKITGVASASADGDVLAYGQSGADLDGLNLTANLVMNSNKITGIADATLATDAPSYGQLQSVAAGVQWKHAVEVLMMVTDADQGGSPPTLTGNDAGKAYVVNNWGGGYTNGDIVEWDGSSFNVIVDEGGAGEPPTGTYVIVIDTGASGSFVSQENKVGVYDAATNTWTFTAPTNGDGRTVVGDGSIYENLGYVWDSTPGEWVLFNGPGQINAGNGLTKTFNTLDVNVKDGVQIDADAVTLLLDGSTPGLQLTGTSPNKVLSVLPNSAAGIDVTASGVEVLLEADGAIVFDGTNGGLETNLETTNPTLAIVTNELGVKYGATTSGLTKDANGLKVNVDGVTVTINGSGQLVASAADAGTVEDEYAVGEAIAVADPVYWSTTADRVLKADAALAQWPTKAQVFGVAETAQATVGQTATITSLGPCTCLATAGVAGSVYWLQVGGGIGTTMPTANNALIRVGWAMNTNDLFVSIFDYGRRGA